MYRLEQFPRCVIGRGAGCRRHEVPGACEWEGGFHSLPFCAFTFLNDVNALPIKENKI